MSRTIWLLSAVAVMSAAACTRVQVELPESEVCFQVASCIPVATKASADYQAYYESVPFGAYAWFKGEDPANDTRFMDNQEVAFVSEKNVWAPVGTTYYWPKSGSLDFICYSPYSEADGPVIGEDSIQYEEWDVSANPEVDLLYADKVSCPSRNASAYSRGGVPVLFRHALARLSFTVQLAYSELTSEETKDKTKWEVSLNSVTLKDVRTTGSLDLSWGDGSWQRPASNTWTPDDTTIDIDLDCSSLTTFVDTTPQDLGEGFLVLPQSLDLGQVMVLNLDIWTWRDSGNGYPADPFITETGIEVEATLDSDTLSAWGINQNIHYVLILTPSRNMDDEITFDPAVADWDNVVTYSEINL